MKLNDLRADVGSRKSRKRLGTGLGSGQGKTGGRGHKGQRSRTGASIARGFEGGQMPLIRRVPKRGFTPRNRDSIQVVNVGMLDRFEADLVVDGEALCRAGLVRSASAPIKLLGDGSIDKKLSVTVTAASRAAISKIESAGGSLTLQEAQLT
ncbi:MAG: 50S ribosomal protein L15 [Mariprofundales bacterium]|nr:50S ribosomal protein L15 [Mariprofundales bacterium]